MADFTGRSYYGNNYGNGPPLPPGGALGFGGSNNNNNPNYRGGGGQHRDGSGGGRGGGGRGGGDRRHHNFSHDHHTNTITSMTTTEDALDGSTVASTIPPDEDTVPNMMTMITPGTTYESSWRHDRHQNEDHNTTTGTAGAAASSASFQLVDTSKTTSGAKRFVTPAARRRIHTTRLRQVNARRQQSSGGGGGGTAAATNTWGMDSKLSTRARGGGGGGSSMLRGGGGGGRGGGGGGRGGGGHYHHHHNMGGNMDRQPSVSVQRDTWIQVEELDLAKLTKQHLHASMMEHLPIPEDVVWAGFVDPYNELYDKVSARQPVPLKRMEHKEFYPVTTTDDPVLEKLAIEELGQVFCTDAILAHLMTCTRSVYPWDIVIQKLPNGILFFDKRDNSQFDYLSVYETSNHPPHAGHNPDDPESINSPERLGLEATMINQNFSQQILKKSGRKEMDLPNPFFDEDDNTDGMEPASVAFRYRKFPLDSKTMLVCRTELHGLVKNTQYMTAFCLNEYQPIAASGSSSSGTTIASASQQQHNTMSWRDKIDNQRGAVLATELKNNSFKLAKWTAQSLLAGADQMKIGFVSRAAPKNPYEHVILATEFYRPKDFAAQITLSEAQMWGMIRFFVQLLQKQETGKYVLLRDPNKAILRLYKVPPETFEEEAGET